jgi:hypothetical protein
MPSLLRAPPIYSSLLRLQHTGGLSLNQSFRRHLSNSRSPAVKWPKNKYGNPCIMCTCHMRHTNTSYEYSMHWRSLRPDVPWPRSERNFSPYWQASRGLCKLSLSAIADFSSIGLRIWGRIWRFFPDRHIGELLGAWIQNALLDVQIWRRLCLYSFCDHEILFCPLDTCIIDCLICQTG